MDSFFAGCKVYGFKHCEEEAKKGGWSEIRIQIENSVNFLHTVPLLHQIQANTEVQNVSFLSKAFVAYF